jgi:hypothetical protein
MKSNRIIIVIVLLPLLVVGVLFLSRKISSPTPPSPPPETQASQLKPEFQEGAFVENPQQPGNFVQSQESIEVSLQAAKGEGTAMVSWDESKLRIFHIVLLNNDWQAIWLVSSLDKGDVTNSAIQNISSFVHSGYVLGDTTEGFQFLENPEQFALVVDQEYYLQMLGLTKDDQSIGINKKFVFTASCFPPSCQ